MQALEFQPYSEKEIAELGLWPTEPDYRCQVLPYFTLGSNTYSTEMRTSKTGNGYLQLVLQVYNSSGKDKIIIDRLMGTAHAKLRAAALCFGLIEKYNMGKFVPEDFIGKCGNLKLRIEKGEGNYPDKNAVGSYLIQSDTQGRPPVPTPVPAGDEHIDQDIPMWD